MLSNHAHRALLGAPALLASFGMALTIGAAIPATAQSSDTLTLDPQ